MTYEFLHSVFPNYTKEMYIGNEPKCFHPHINGDSIEEYDDYQLSGSIIASRESVFDAVYRIDEERNKGNKNIIIYIDPPYANTTGYKETFDIYSLEGQIWSTSPIYISEGYKMQGASESYLLSVGRTKGNISGEAKKKPTEEWLNRFNLI